MGFPKDRKEFEKNYYKIRDPADDHFIWSYTSPEFPMDQVNQYEEFKFPEPVLCVGGYVMIELLGWVRRDDYGLFYIIIENVKVVGRSLSPAFHAEVQDSSGKFVLEYDTSKIQQTVERDEKPARKKKRHEMIYPMELQ